MTNLLFTSVGRRVELINIFRQKSCGHGTVVAVDNANTAPALYSADFALTVPLITNENYIDILLDICRRHDIHGVTTCIDPEITLLSQHAGRFEKDGVCVLHSPADTVEICFDKFRMYSFLVDQGYDTPLSFDSLASFESAEKRGDIRFPVFVKPRTGSGSVGIEKIESHSQLVNYLSTARCDSIIQEYMQCEEYDADVYVDLVTKKLVSTFTKKKLSSRLGGADKTVSCKAPALFELIEDFVHRLGIVGPADIDFFKRDGRYFISEVNPRFGGAYLHAHACGINFPKLVRNNLNGQPNEREIGNYEEGVYMMMYDSVIFKRSDELC